ncbi:hypothetical protein F1559_001400 [Cyanidiococcus yangmingshanensis]|uniref:Uncharacterized protein n=1 Tax=Cyanidiococcus yangmingshanensis TaxID=2690220 RepID=A0A7J7IIL8_9RHOD|nr:hypothetical protein F1559_001400 [Cyanidiococcus yangmingshanensis]
MFSAAVAVRTIRMHRLRNIWCLDLGLVSTSVSKKFQEPIWLWLYSGGADGTVGLFPLTWPLGLVPPTPKEILESCACVPRNKTVKTTDLDARFPSMIESVQEQACGSLNSAVTAAPALPPLEHQTSTLLPGREHARAMVMLASVQLLCISTNARRVLAFSVDRQDWTELFAGDDSIDFVPASIAAADKSPWVFFGASHCRSTILALQLDVSTTTTTTTTKSPRTPVISIRSERWQARTELQPVTLLHLWNDQVLFAATADGTVLAFDLTNLLDNHQPGHSLEPLALFPVPDGVVSQPSAIGLIPAPHRADKASPLGTWKTSLDAVAVGHRSGQMRLHPISTRTATTPATVPCTQRLRPHEDRLSSIMISSNNAVDDANTEDDSGTLHVLSMDGTCSRFQRLSDTAHGGGTLRLVLCSREKCPVECEQGDVLYKLSDGTRAWPSTLSCVQGSVSAPACSVLLASGFRGHHYGVWRLETGQTLFVVPCGGWRRPHVLYERRSTGNQSDNHWLCLLESWQTLSIRTDCATHRWCMDSPSTNQS